MDYAIPGAFARSKSYSFTVLNSSDDGALPDRCVYPDTAADRYISSMLLSVAVLTDYLVSVDFGFHVLVFPASEPELFSNFDKWRIEHHLPAYIQKNVRTRAGDEWRKFTVAVLTGKKFSFPAYGDDAYEKYTAEVFHGMGIKNFKFFTCHLNRTGKYQLNYFGKFHKKGYFTAGEYGLSTDNQDYTLMDCLKQVLGEDKEIFNLCSEHKSIREILLLKMRNDLKDMGSWQNPNVFSSGSRHLPYPESLVKAMENSPDYTEELLFPVNTAGSFCRALEVLKEIYRQGLVFYSSSECMRIYEQLAGSREFCRLLNFTPYTTESFHPLTYRDLEFMFRNKGIYGSSSILGLISDSRHRELFAGEISRSIVSFAGKNSTLQCPESENLDMLAHHRFKAFYTVTLKKTLSAVLNECGDAAADIMTSMEIINDGRSFKLSGRFDPERDYFSLFTGSEPGGRPFFLDVEEAMPAYRNLHACFCMVHKLALLTDADNFIFGYDTPFSSDYITAMYSRCGKNSPEAEALLLKGVLMRGFSSKLICGGTHAVRVYSLKGAFDRVMLLSGCDELFSG